jgi:predicted ArsR family transcriptional regulator
VFLRLNPKSQVWRYWNQMCYQHSVNMRLSPTPLVILGYLLDHGEAYQIQIANETGLNQGNLSYRHMPNLIQAHFVDYREVERLYVRRPNQPSKKYRISDNGRKVLQLMREYDGGELLGRALMTSPWFVPDARRNALTTNLSKAG